MAVCINVIQSLARQLPDVVIGARADSTANAYSGAFNKWHDWPTKYNKCVIAADARCVPLFMTFSAFMSLIAITCSYIKFIDKQKAVAGLSSHKLA